MDDDHSEPRPETHDPRRRTETFDPGPPPEAGVDDPGQGRPGPARGRRPADDVSEAPERPEQPER